MTQNLNPGQTLQGGAYRIVKVLGQGSFGITYLAMARLKTQGKLGSMDVEARVAIKEFFMGDVNTRRADGSGVDGSGGTVFTNYRRKFRKEAENLSRLAHDGIVKVLDVFDENNTTYYVMEFLDGDNLDDYINRRGPLPEAEAVGLLREAGVALAYMHSRQMLHLDMKPKNIMRKADGSVRLIDFGLSKSFTDDGEPESSTTVGLGTPGYAPVEQAGYRQDGSFPATLDVYALGATLFKMLTGKRPPEATLLLNEGFPATELTARGVSATTVSALEKAMEPMRKKRFQSVADLLAALPGSTRATALPDDESTVIATPAAPKSTPVPTHEAETNEGSNTDDEDAPQGANNRKYWIVCALTVFAIICIICALYPLVNPGYPTDEYDAEYMVTGDTVVAVDAVEAVDVVAVDAVEAVDVVAVDAVEAVDAVVTVEATEVVPDFSEEICDSVVAVEAW